MTTAHNENHMTDFFSAQEFPRRVNTLEILQQAEQHRAQELARLGAAFGRFVRRTVISPIVVAYQRQRMYEELSQLSDRVLEDIGVSRGNIIGADDVKTMAKDAIILAMASPLGACGRKGSPEFPEGTKYPRDYPKKN